MRAALLAAALAGPALGLPWPHHPMNSPHHIGNAWGSYQYYGSGFPYLHNGQDIITASLAPCVAIKAGYVKRVWYGGSPLYNGVTVGDSAGAGFCNALMYYHLDNTTIRVQDGDTVRVGDTLGLVSNWPVASFHHNHFSWNRNSGVIWQGYGGFFRNPLLDLVPNNDSVVPNFLDAYPGQRFAICANNSPNYQSKDSVHGSVDLICRLEDRINHRLWKVAVYKIVFTIRDSLGATVVPPTRGFEFCDSLDAYTATQARVVYKQDATCPTRCDYDSLNRRFYYIFTNTDGDSTIEATDSLASWNTTAVADGRYRVFVTASDQYGNTVTDSMTVRVINNPPPRHDVGVSALVMPALVDRGLIVAPLCTVYNYGNSPESYTVRLRIGAAYDSTLGVTGHAPGAPVALGFPPWMAPAQPGPYPVSCSTRLAGDMTPANDARYCTTRVALHNVAALAILAPRDTVDSGAVVVPRAIVRNTGDRSEVFTVRFGIGTGYSDPQPVTLAAGATDTVDFTPWTALALGTHPTRCSTELAGDDDPTDDKVEDSVYVVPGSGIGGEPARFALGLDGVRPNPLAGTGRVRFALPAPGPVEVMLYDAGGRRAAVLFAGQRAAGRHELRFDVRGLAPGVYWLSLQAGGGTLTRKVTVRD
ncbi:MAG: peptidoglycan DD-metalloendopeptidase family protein [bacterium]